MKTNSIAEFLHRKLQHLNDTTRVNVPKVDESEEAAILKVKKSMENWNFLVDRLGAENPEELKIAIPSAFKRTQVYQTADGSLKLEILN